SKDALHCLQILGRVSQPMVVDASALEAKFLQSLQSEQVVITPHPGEAAALLNISRAQVQADRLATSAALAAAFGATCVLKGSGTLVAQPGSPTAINTRGNPGMASAGMGDVLTGIIAAMIGQGLPLFEAASSAVLIHALCAENFCADKDQVGLIAGDIIERIPRVIRQQRDLRPE
ncbi:MAG: NAD(P)H-hydrate dehydratase, partial [Gammaproteobacteria bacterium]|nr:NAD(P)H-hydrate dehydratase [Gammaproteobacteria bacterium]